LVPKIKLFHVPRRAKPLRGSTTHSPLSRPIFDDLRFADIDLRVNQSRGQATDDKLSGCVIWTTVIFSEVTAQGETGLGCSGRLML
jgi:hypothetical protein